MKYFTKNSDTRDGFTLLELTVVIAIIGLVTGAILAGQSFLRQSRLATMMNEAKYYRQAYNLFETKYGGIPGDLPNAQEIWGVAPNCAVNGSAVTSGTCNGNGDGFVTATPENFYVFHHLMRAGLINGTYTGAPGPAGSTQAVTGSNVPASVVDNVSYMFMDIAPGWIFGNSNYFDGYYKHRMVVASKVPGAAGYPLSPFLTPKEMLQLDTKYDDGHPGTGTVRTNKTLTSCVAGIDPATATYLISDQLDCWFLFTE
jgi:prepilin-type N-terminal cleavage/methylation domain-containing protein